MTACESCGKTPASLHVLSDIDNQWQHVLELALDEANELLLDVWLQFSLQGKKKWGTSSRHAGGLSTLERCQSYLERQGVIDGNGWLTKKARVTFGYGRKFK